MTRNTELDGDWVLAAVATASQHPALREGGPDYDEVLAAAIRDNANKALQSMMPKRNIPVTAHRKPTDP